MFREELVKKDLELMEVDVENLPSYLIDYLNKIHTVFEAENELKTRSIDVLKSLSLSASSISNTLSISRNTIYRHDKLLLRYIEFLNNRLSSGNPIEEMKLMKILISEKEEQINKLLNRDVDIELLKLEIIKLSDIIKEKNIQLAEKDKIITDLRRHESSQSNNKINGVIHKIK